MAWHDMQKVLDMNRTPETIRENRRAFAAGIAKITSGFRPGQTSLGAARDDERLCMEKVTAARLALHTALTEAAKVSELREHQLLRAADALGDLIHDHDLGRDVWTAELEAMS